MTDSQETETTPLLQATLSADSSRAPSDGQGKGSDYLAEYTFYVVLVVLLLVDAGTALAVLPTTSALQDVICERYYARQRGTMLVPIGERDCKAAPVQRSLTMVKGLVSLLLLLPGVVLGISYATMAERWGIKSILLLSISGMFLGELWFDVVCWWGRIWPVELVYLTPVFYLIGGGPSVGASLLFVLVANSSPSDLRPSRFFLLEASAYSGNVFGYIASSAIMDKTLWTPVLLGLGLILISFCLVLPVPDQRPLSTEPEQQETSQLLSNDGPPKSTPFTLRTAIILLKEQSSLVILLLGFLLRSLGASVMRLLIIYASQLFNWSFSRSGYLLSLDSTIHLVVLLLLPTVDRWLLSRRGFAGVSKDFALAKGSILLSALGCAGMALSPSPSLLAISILLYGLGGGYGQSIRSILTISMPEEHRAITYSLIGIMDTLGTLIGTLLWPLVYQTGLKLTGPWVGLPFVTSAGLFGIVYLTLLFGRRVHTN